MSPCDLEVSNFLFLHSTREESKSSFFIPTFLNKIPRLRKFPIFQKKLNIDHVKLTTFQEKLTTDQERSTTALWAKILTTSFLVSLFIWKFHFLGIVVLKKWNFLIKRDTRRDVVSIFAHREAIKISPQKPTSFQEKTHHRSGEN